MKKDKAETEGQPDEEGWVTVGRRGRKPGAARIDAAEIQENKKKKKNQVRVLNLFDLFTLPLVLICCPFSSSTLS